jgi:23S rRNA (guanosine2251-2'-O)-methyltransferase
MVIYGRHPLREALRAGIIPKVVYVADGVRLDSDLQWLLTEEGISVRTVSRAQLEQIAHSSDHQGVAADIGEFPLAPLREVLQRAMESSGVVLGLDHLQDPRNAGSLIRSAEALGACGVVLPPVRSVGITPAVVKASAGACFHIPIAIGNLRQFAKRFEEAGGFVAVLDMDGDDIRKAPKLRPPLPRRRGGRRRCVGEFESDGACHLAHPDDRARRRPQRRRRWRHRPLGSRLRNGTRDGGRVTGKQKIGTPTPRVPRLAPRIITDGGDGRRC